MVRLLPPPRGAPFEVEDGAADLEAEWRGAARAVKPGFTMALPWSGVSAFLAVAERGGFTAAARALGRSPSAVSQAVRALEQRVGVPLVLRTTRSVRLTEAGAALARQAGPAVAAVGQAVEAAAGHAGQVAGTLRLTVGRIAVPLVVEPVLGAALARHPRLAIDVSVDDRFVDVVAEGFDAGVRLSESIEPDLTAVRLTPPFRFVVVGSPAYLARRGEPRRPEELVEHDAIVYRSATTGAVQRWDLERGGRTRLVSVRGRVTCNDARLLVRGALDGLGLAYVDEHSARAHLLAGTLREVLVPWAPEVPGFFLYFPRRARGEPKLQAFLEVAREVLLGAPPGNRSQPGTRARR
jgi:DNA-binding transcriptional LysR family regulator